jgi:hypothetical protein
VIEKIASREFVMRDERELRCSGVSEGHSSCMHAADPPSASISHGDATVGVRGVVRDAVAVTARSARSTIFREGGDGAVLGWAVEHVGEAASMFVILSDGRAASCGDRPEHWFLRMVLEGWFPGDDGSY